MQTQNPASNPLAGLKDVHIPTEVSWWPLAWGWWVLAGAAVIALGLLVWQIWRKRRFNRARQYALAQVKQVDSRQEDWAYQLNALLKRTAGAYFDQQRIGGLYGKRWLAFLLTHVSNQRKRKQVSEGLEKLQEALYKHNKPPQQDFKVCQQACLIWLKHARLRSSPSFLPGQEIKNV